MKKILIIDDSLNDQGIVENILKPLGYELAFGSDGAEGFRKALEIQPDLILLDLVMPNVDGFDTQMLLQNEPKTKSIPVLFMTAQDSLEFNLRVMEHGAVGYIEKPIDRNRLIKKIEALFEGGGAKKSDL